MPALKYIAEMTKFTNDMYGNPISHFVLRDANTHEIVAQTNRRRVTCGYGSHRADGPIVALRAIHKKGRVTVTNFKGRRSDKLITAWLSVKL